MAKFHALFWLKDGERKVNEDMKTQLLDMQKQPPGQVELLEESFNKLVNDFEIGSGGGAEIQAILDKNYGLQMQEIAA